MMKRLVAGLALVVAAGFAVMTFADADSGGHYRLATATTGDVAQTVTISGAVDHVNRANLAFGTGGTVATLTVTPGTAVTAGQQLGTLDSTSLQATVDKAKADLADAQDSLTAAEDSAEAQDSAATQDTETPVAPPDAVHDAQAAADTAVSAAADALTAQQKACADPTSADCATTMTATQTAQQATRKAQAALQAALSAYSKALSAQASSQPDGRTGGTGGTGGSATSVPDAQAAVDQASARLLEAQQAVTGATLTSPTAGTVASVSTSAGDAVSAGTTVVVVIGAGAAEVSATVPVAQVQSLAVGQTATVTPVGTTAPVPGTVTRVGTLPDSSAQGVAYPVTVTVDDPPASMASGSSATAAIVVATAKHVLTIPTSAVHRGGRTSVDLLLNGQPVTTPVTIGAVGPDRTEVTEGLKAGDQVVLANLDTPLPTGDQQTPGGGFSGGRPAGTRIASGGR